MIDPSRIQFPKVNKTFLKGFFWLLVFLFLASVFSSARGIYDRFLRKPEVRKDVVQLGQDVRLGNQLWIQRAIIIHNRGNDDARNVQIKCLFPNGMITRIIVISEEEYSEISDSNSTKSCTYSLPRFGCETSQPYYNVSNASNLLKEIKFLSHCRLANTLKLLLF